jgi:hypothetical protein
LEGIAMMLDIFALIVIGILIAVVIWRCHERSND